MSTRVVLRIIRWRLFPAVALVTAMAAACVPACSRSAALTRQVEAGRLASALQVHFTRAVDAGNRAVMADTDEASAAGAREAEQATRGALHDSDQLRSTLNSLAYSNELQFLDRFDARFRDLQKLDGEILPLAVENTNLKAQRLSFGPAADAAAAFRAAVEMASRAAPPGNAAQVEAAAGHAIAGMLDIRVLQAPHIAEPEDAAMTRIEQQMRDDDTSVRTALGRMKALLGTGADAQLNSAMQAFDRFMAVNKEIVALSRRNTNVRSLALSLGSKRMVVAQCDDALRALQDGLSKRSIGGTR